jgi:hypothetical protein
VPHSATSAYAQRAPAATEITIDWVGWATGAARVAAGLGAVTGAGPPPTVCSSAGTPKTSASTIPATSQRREGGPSGPLLSTSGPAMVRG